jgi:hypothetical protein|uniref:Uncharacterized protein n=1 Tax=Desulfobacca acetoxidans TaxID=60893 RepID=A0A7C3YZR6_9BACT
MKKYLPDVLLLALGLLVMALLIYIIAQSQGSGLSLIAILALTLVWISWYRHVVRLALNSLGAGPDDEDDLPSFPG